MTVKTIFTLLITLSCLSCFAQKPHSAEIQKHFDQKPDGQQPNGQKPKGPASGSPKQGAEEPKAPSVPKQKGKTKREGNWPAAED